MTIVPDDDAPQVLPYIRYNQIDVETDEDSDVVLDELSIADVDASMTKLAKITVSVDHGQLWPGKTSGDVRIDSGHIWKNQQIVLSAPQSAQTFERQLIKCNATGGSISFRIFGEVTSKVPYDANASEFESYLNQVGLVSGSIRVTSADDDGDAICSLTSTGVFVDFTGIAGNICILSVADDSDLEHGDVYIAEETSGSSAHVNEVVIVSVTYPENEPIHGMFRFELDDKSSLPVYFPFVR